MKSHFITVIRDYLIRNKPTTVATTDDKSRESLDGETLWLIHPDFEIIESTSHELESTASAAGWVELRNHMLAAVTEIVAMPLSQVCLHCDQFAFYRCQQCWPLGFYCQDYFIDILCV